MKKLFTLFPVLCLSFMLKSATFESVTTGNWNATSTWTMTSGSDADGLPDNNDDVVINSGHVVKLVGTSICRAIWIKSGGDFKPSGKVIYFFGNFLNDGVVSGTLGTFILAKTGMTFSSVTTVSLSSLWVGASATIVSGTSINVSGNITLQYSNTVLTNQGNISTKGVLTLYNGSNVKWVNANGSTLTLEKQINRNSSSKLDFSANTNTVTYQGYNSLDIDSTTFYHLIIKSAGIKSLRGNTRVKGDLTVTQGTGMTLQFKPNAKKLTLFGNVTMSAQYVRTTGDSLVFEGAAQQAINGTQAINAYDVIINKTNKTDSITCNNSLFISHELDVQKGTCNSGANNLRLLSDASTTARLNTVNPTNVNFTGSMVIQRFFPAVTQPTVSPIGDTYNYFYHDLSSPVSNTIVNDWDNEIYISGIGDYDGIGGPAGIDGSIAGFSNSMHTYVETSDKWAVVTGSNTALTPAKGYNLLLLDDNDPSGFTWDAKIIDSRGVPNFGDVSIGGLTRTNGKGVGYNLLGNPYASPIILATPGTHYVISAGTIGSDLYFEDVATGTLKPFAKATTTISPHQGFFVIRSTGGGSRTFTFKEASKVKSYTTTNNFRREAHFYDILLNISSNDSRVSHECEVNFNQNASLNYDEEFDGLYKQIRPIAPNIYFVDKNEECDGFVKNYINSKEDEVVLPLGLFTPANGMYAINSSVLNTDAYNYAWIENLKTGEKYDINKSIPFEGKEQSVNYDFALRLSKQKQNNAISESLIENDLLIFSTQNTLNLKSTKADYALSEVILYDVAGKLVMQSSNIALIAQEAYQMDLSSLASGVYIVKVISNSGKVVSKRIVK